MINKKYRISSIKMLFSDGNVTSINCEVFIGILAEEFSDFRHSIPHVPEIAWVSRVYNIG